MLLWTPARSEASSYNRLIDDMGEDGKLAGPFVAVACTVADLDLKRERSLAYVSVLSDWEAGNAIGRIRENRLITAWVHRALHWRLASYRYALERLVISVPSVLAVEAERALVRFQAIVAQADPALARCAGVEFQAVAAALRSSRNRSGLRCGTGLKRVRGAPSASGRAPDRTCGSGSVRSASATPRSAGRRR